MSPAQTPVQAKATTEDGHGILGALGFAFYLAMDVCVSWGGVFPFLPSDFQTDDVTLTFYLAKTVATVIAFAVLLVSSFYAPKVCRRLLDFVGVPSFLLGSVGVVAMMYLPSVAMAVLVASGFLLGLGSTFICALWLCVFAARPGEQGDRLIIEGTGLSALVYLVLSFLPEPVVAFLIPLVLLPLCGVALTLSEEGVEQDQPMFTDQPTAQRKVYAGAMRDNWKSALVAGGVGFAAETLRAFALVDVDTGHIVNMTSMLGSAISATVLMALWYRFSFHFNIVKSYRVLFPLLVVALLVLTLNDMTAYVGVYAGGAYMLSAFVQMVLLLQCAQASRDIGVSPAFIYAFCMGIMGAMRLAGFFCGWWTGLAREVMLQQLAMASLIDTGVLGGVLYAIWIRPPRNRRRESRAIEFVAWGPERRAVDTGAGVVAGQRIAGQASLSDAASASRPAVASRPDEGQGPLVGFTTYDDPIAHPIDRISKQCLAVKRAFRLGDREEEVMELYVRGNTLARIATELEISENTVRTHIKRVYSKLDVHTKQGLVDLISQFGPNHG